MPKRTKESRSSNRHSGNHFSPKRSTRGPEYPMGPARASRSDSHNSGRISPHSMSGGVKQANGSLRHQMHTDSPILIEDDDDYKNVDSSAFRDNGNNLKPDIGESTQIVKHFVASADSRHHVTSVPEKPMFRGPETDVLHDLEKDKLKIIRVQMIRADVPQSDTYHKSYTIEDDASRTKGDNHQHYDDRQPHFNPTHYDHADTKYGVSPRRSRDQSLSPRRDSRPPSPPLPYSSNINHYAETNTHRESRSKRSSDRNVHDRSGKKHKFDDFASGPPPEPRSPSNSHFRSSDHSRRRSRDKSVRYDNRPRHSDNSSPPCLENRYPPFRSPSPNNHPFSPPNERPSRRMPFSPPPPPPPRELSSPLKDQTPEERARKKRSPVSRRDRSRERRRRTSPKRKTPPTARSPRRREIDHRRKRSTSRNRERKREGRERRRRSRSKSNSPQDQEDYSPQNQPVYPVPPHGVRLPPPRPYPGPMMIPLRPPPPYPPPMGAWRPPRPPMQGPPPPGSAWPYPRPRPFYYPY